MPERSKSPIVMAAVDIAASVELNDAILRAVRQVLLNEPGAQLARVVQAKSQEGEAG